MSGVKKALLLVGSPGEEKSVSNKVGSYLAEKFNARGIETEKAYVSMLIRPEAEADHLMSLVDPVDLLILASPLYVDCLPAIMVKAMETIYERRIKDGKKKQMLIAVLNCGKDVHENDTAADICRRFAASTGMEWAGSIRIGMGRMLGRMELKETNEALKGLCKGLDMSAVALSEGKPIPAEAEELCSRPFITAEMMAAEAQRMAAVSKDKQGSLKAGN
jgi:multimeric flavodoxin WrbA